jgi:hypothetical protein
MEVLRLERSDHVVFVIRRHAGPGIGATIVDNDREGWQYTQILLDRSSMCAERLQTETVWQHKYDLSPSLANMHQ